MHQGKRYEEKKKRLMKIESAKEERRKRRKMSLVKFIFGTSQHVTVKIRNALLN